jgi:rod shape determining protein RodA
MSKSTITKGIDGSVVLIYFLLVIIGIASITAVELKPNDNFLQGLLGFSKSYSRQFIFFLVALCVALFILITDSKFFTATANLQYAFGIILMLLVFAIGTEVKGTRSIIRLGGFQFQPADICKVFTALALAKFLSRSETNFNKTRHQLIAAAICLVPAVLSIAQKEVGLALVYFSFFIALYREGLPTAILVIGASVIVILLMSIIFDKDTFIIAIASISLFIIVLLRKQITRKRGLLYTIILLAGLSISFGVFAVPFIFKNISQPHQTQRIFDLIGKPNPYANKPEVIEAIKQKKRNSGSASNYNVEQSKKAIANGGFLGTGYLRGTVTAGNLVPEQSTDFIFCTIGESFGFLGSLVFLLLFGILLYRMVIIAERQRSVFSRVYAYSVASIFFFHLLINVGMVTGVMPVIGIPLPFVSYGGTSMLTFTILLFILVKLDADRQMVLR